MINVRILFLIIALVFATNNCNAAFVIAPRINLEQDVQIKLPNEVSLPNVIINSNFSDQLLNEDLGIDGRGTPHASYHLPRNGLRKSSFRQFNNAQKYGKYGMHGKNTNMYYLVNLIVCNIFLSIFIVLAAVVGVLYSSAMKSK